MGFEPPPGVSRRAYHFLWATEEQLDAKVMDDIVWVRERFAQARQSEPGQLTSLFDLITPSNCLHAPVPSYPLNIDTY